MPKEIIKRDADGSGRVQAGWGLVEGSGGLEEATSIKGIPTNRLLLTDDTILGIATFCSPPGQK